MKHTRKLLPLAALLALSACAGQQRVVTRADTDAFAFSQASAQSPELHQQTRALNASADQLVRASTMKGAAIGAAIGCGLTVVSASNASNCLTNAAVGAVGGAVIGNMQGKRDVARRVEIANPNSLVRNTRKANAQMAFVKDGLPAHLAQQDADLRHLKIALESQSIGQAIYDQRIDLIRQDRAHLAHALTLTSKQAKTAVANLKDAAAQGQTGLDWHILAASDIAEEATSARSSIDLL